MMRLSQLVDDGDAGNLLEPKGTQVSQRSGDLNPPQPSRLSITPRRIISKPRSGPARRSAVGHRGAGFSMTETTDLLDFVEHELPVSGENWTKVAVLHAEKWSKTVRTMKGLRRKFHSLWKRIPPAGDPSCTLHVQRAKRINRMIASNAGISDDVNDDLDLPENELRLFADASTTNEQMSTIQQGLLNMPYQVVMQVNLYY